MSTRRPPCLQLRSCQMLEGTSMFPSNPYVTAKIIDILRQKTAMLDDRVCQSKRLPSWGWCGSMACAMAIVRRDGSADHGSGAGAAVIGQLADHPAIGLMAGDRWAERFPRRYRRSVSGESYDHGRGDDQYGNRRVSWHSCGWSPWLSLPLVFLFACAASLAGVFGNAAAKVSFLSLMLFVLMVGLPAGFSRRC